jgi:serine/threonine protein kinase
VEEISPVIGKNLAHYEITSQLGKGGMGEVFRAKDQKLGREVAIKVLPEEFAKDADRVARFQREAKVLASLNHPNIAAIYGLEESGGTNFLVLELVEGETLADRINQGPIPVEEALKLALQIAEALESAHEKGVIHRDLKPANIKVTLDGKVKVLDFGLAKAFAGEQAELNLSNSPTLSDMATQQGVILGTAAYMSPEQARGKPLDKRADIWAFGCVLYEMLTGQAAFQGDDVTEILAAVVKSGVNLDLLPTSIHPRVREAIIRSLQKDLKRRYHDVADARYEVEQALADPHGILVQQVAGIEPRTKLGTILPWAAALLGVIITGMAVWCLKPSEPRQVTRFDYELPKDQQWNNSIMPMLAVSPDGRRFVYTTSEGLYLRSLDQPTAKLIPGGDKDPSMPFFLSDGKWVGYWSRTQRQLKKIIIGGGTPMMLADSVSVSLASKISSGSEDTVVFVQQGKGIVQLSKNGGSPKLLIEDKDRIFMSAQLLPDGKSVLFTRSIGTRFDMTVMVKSFKSDEAKGLFPGDSAQYLPTGHIVYSMGASLYAVPFDVGKLEVTGDPFLLVGDVFRSSGVAQYAVSNSGTLVYIPGITSSTAKTNQRILVWVDRKGKEELLAAQPDDYRSPQISPDGKQLALIIKASGRFDVWIRDLANQITRSLTSDGADKRAPLWTPDGKRIVYTVVNDGICWQAADGSGTVDRLFSTPSRMLLPWSFSKDGKTLLMTEAVGVGLLDIGMLSMEGSRTRKPLLQEEKYLEVQPEISPDGRWMAYTSTESGKAEVYVRPFPEIDKGKWQVSSSGGSDPLWSPDGRELFYMRDDCAIAVAVESEPTFKPGKSFTLFQGAYARLMIAEGHRWAISPDGKRFLMMKGTGLDFPFAEMPRKINIVLNWTEELKQKVPVK